ncbi:hypothetical protein VTK73DRAFT_2742 [Phialemonium thermophilum]|uniref:Xylanolytic transcriptional activator regulatory domain-containing protein n=1 Tax=Phialemonium thermophilum TaxID=223376 RepID=A0ABR3Y2F1_9PEZI
MVYHHIQLLYCSCGITFAEASKRFKRTFQNWFPIISPQRLRKLVAATEDGTPAADDSILLLSICLVTAQPADDVAGIAAPTAALYAAMKMLYGQVQAVVQGSITLVQAGLIISAYEYASNRLDSAYVSIAACARMAQSTGIDLSAFRAAQRDTETTLRPDAMEHCNIWWAIVILERFIMLETCRNRYQSPTAACPDYGFSLPFDFDGGDTPTIRGGSNVTIPSQSSYGLRSFAQQAQAVHLLDRILRIISSPDNPERRLWQLLELDGKLQKDLLELMQERLRPGGLKCGAIATLIRSLYVLHQEIIATAPILSSLADHESWQRRSKAALDTATRIMAEVAEHHLDHIVHHGVDSLPFCCAGNLRVAKKYIKHHCRGCCNGDDFSRSGLRQLMLLEEAFCDRWGAPVTYAG